MEHKRRAGFTLTELLIVIGILLILSTLVFAVFNAGKSSDRMRSAARAAQSAFLGAKDRAVHAKDLRGVRLTRDLTDPNLVNGFVYLQSLGNLTYPAGSIELDRVVNGANLPVSPDVTIVRGFPKPAPMPVDWDVKQGFFSNPYRIRIPSGTGQWYAFSIDTSGQYALGQKDSSGNTIEALRLVVPFPVTTGAQPYPNYYVAYPTNSAYSSCDIQLGNDVLPFHQPISFSSGVVIDLKASSANVWNASQQGPLLDLMFSPRGAIAGPTVALGPLHFMLRDLKDATSLPIVPNYTPGNVVLPDGWIVSVTANTPLNPNQGDRMILTVYPQTGLVQTFEMDLTDNFNNITLAAGADGYADNPFSFAQQGRSAGR